ncbi:hypothetical protein AAY473_040006 [Plecturocebus cupreus]
MKPNSTRKATKLRARRHGSHLQCQHFVRPRPVNHSRSKKKLYELKPNNLISTSKGLSPQKNHFGKPGRVDHLRSGVQNQPGQHGETPSLMKIQKLARLWVFKTLYIQQALNFYEELPTNIPIYCSQLPKSRKYCPHLTIK